MASTVFNSSKLPFSQNPNKNRRMRVADLLLRDEDGDGDGGEFDSGGGGSAAMGGDRGGTRAVCGGGLDYPSLRRVIGRWLKLVGIGKSKERIESSNGSVPTRCSTKCSSGGNELRSDFKELNDGSEPSGPCTKETYFSLGVGFSLLHLIAESKNELNKVAELRKEIENFLQITKEGLQKKDALSKLSGPYSTTDIPEGSNSNSNLSVQFSTASYDVLESETILECDRSSGCDSPKHEFSVERMNQLEEELEAELERLQLRLDKETVSEHLHMQMHEVSVSENGTIEECGVPPHLLERRLHKLLESRQEDRIRQLEATLDCFRHKELELSWWKDSFHTMSRQRRQLQILISLHELYF